MRRTMHEAHRAAYRAELDAAAEAQRAGDPDRAWCHLERSHIVAQPFPVAHVGSHARMLWLAVQVRDRREMSGQVVRLLVAGPGSLVGRFPVGNTGRASVPLTAEMPIPSDLAGLLADTR